MSTQKVLKLGCKDVPLDRDSMGYISDNFGSAEVIASIGMFNSWSLELAINALACQVAVPNCSQKASLGLR